MFKFTMFYYVYILKSRKKQHDSGKNLSTKPFTPYNLVFYEVFLIKNDVKNREAYLKSGYRERTVKKMLKIYFKNSK